MTVCLLCCSLLGSCNSKQLQAESKKPLKGVVVGYIPGGEFLDAQEMIRWEYLTHVNVSFLYIHGDGSIDDTLIQKAMPTIVDEAHRQGVKVLISLQSDGKNGFATAVKNAETRSKLVTTVINYARHHKLDGIDVDYEIYDSVCPELILFVSELYRRKGSDLLQTCAVAQWNPTNEGGYTTEWHRYFDLINIMSYDNTGGWSTEGQHASYEQAIDGIRMWTQTLEAPAAKLVLGLPFYGYSWDETQLKIDSSRAVRYSQLFDRYPNEAVEKVDQVERTYYNGQPTIRRKCRYAIQSGLAGVMVWQLFQDSRAADKSLMQAIGQEMVVDIHIKK